MTYFSSKNIDNMRKAMELLNQYSRYQRIRVLYCDLLRCDAVRVWYRVTNVSDESGALNFSLLLPLKWKHKISSKCYQKFSRLHSVISQMIVVLIFTSMKTLNITEDVDLTIFLCGTDSWIMQAKDKY
jgi:hypothetical protein